MNRIQSTPPLHSAPVTSPQPQVLQGKLTVGGRKTKQALFVPMHYEPNYAYPLVVWLHGPGDNENQLKRVMPLVSMRNYAAVAPRGTLVCRKEGAREGFAWCQSELHVSAAEQEIFEAIEVAMNKVKIAPQRVFIGGYDCGGTMAFRLAMRYPERFAGVLSFGGPFPVGQTPLARLERSRKVPVFVACGRDSDVYPGNRVANDLRLFHAAGMAVAIRLYPGEQGLSTQMLSDMDRWIMELVAPGSNGGARDE